MDDNKNNNYFDNNNEIKRDIEKPEENINPENENLGFNNFTQYSDYGDENNYDQDLKDISGLTTDTFNTSENTEQENHNYDDFGSYFNKYSNINNQTSEFGFEDQTPLRPNYHYNNTGNYENYENRSIVATVMPNNTDTPTNNIKTKKKKNNGVSFFSRMVSYALVAVMAGSAGGSAAYMYIKNNEQLPKDSIIKEAENKDNSNISTANNSSGNKDDIVGVVETAADSVVEITTSIEQQNPFVGAYVESGAGSGVIISEDGYIVTNNHVIEGATSIMVRTSDGKEYEAELIGSDKETDLAVLKIDGSGLKAVTMADSDQIQVGELAVAIGNPLGTLGGTVTNGIVSAKDRKIQIDGEVMTLLQTSAAVNPGNSGGGLFNNKGQLIGIVNAKSKGEEVEGLGFAIPSNLVKEVVDDIVEKGYVSGRPRLGIQVVDISTPEEALTYRVDGEGVYVAKNEGDSDLKVGDRIDQVDGKDIKINSNIKDALKSFEAGDSVNITVTREGKQITLPVLLTESIPE